MGSMNNPRGEPAYRTRDFAALAHVTVRTLRHYEQVGLLTPRRTAAGYRLYAAHELRSLEEIAALKAIGLSLSAIASLRRRGPAELADAIRAQRQTLDDKRRLLDRALRTITDFEQAFQSGSSLDQALRQIIRLTSMHDNNNDDWQEVYESLMQVWHLRRASMSPEMLAEIGREWETLAADVHQALGENPSGPNAQRLATRMRQVLMRLYGDDIPPAKWVTAARNMEKWSPSFGAWQGWSFLSEALAVNIEAV